MEDAIAVELHKPNGNRLQLETILNQLPDITPSQIALASDTITIGSKEDLSRSELNTLTQSLRHMMPWRKGPFSIFGQFIDTEWRSDWKWQRLAPHISNLAGRKVLDVGCGSGYHCWRMYGEGANYVLGIDPSILYWMQFRLCKYYIGEFPVFFAPIPMSGIPHNTQFFDTVFSMGVLYHRKDPFSHLERLKQALRKDGELVLETLITEGPLHHCLVPSNRYAQMRNVWFLPSPSTLSHWLSRAGFYNIRVIDINQTSLQEQRTTDWMQFQSLVDFLDPENHNLTIEGHPAPKRIIILANRK